MGGGGVSADEKTVKTSHWSKRTTVIGPDGWEEKGLNVSICEEAAGFAPTPPHRSTGARAGVRVLRVHAGVQPSDTPTRPDVRKASKENQAKVNSH